MLRMDNSFHFLSATKESLIDPQDRDGKRGSRQFHQESITTPPIDFPEPVQLPVTPMEFAEAGHFPKTHVSAPHLRQENRPVPYGQQKTPGLSIADVMTLQMSTVEPALRKVNSTDIAEVKTVQTPVPAMIPQISNATELVEMPVQCNRAC